MASRRAVPRSGARSARPASREKKVRSAAERERPDVAAARAAFHAAQPALDPAHVVTLDEFGTNLEMTRTYARAPRGTRAVGVVPGRTAGNLTLLFALRRTRVVAPLVVRGAVDTAVFEAWVRGHLGPHLRRGDVVILDRNNPHRAASVAAEVARRGARVLLLPPYSPEWNPTEEAGSKVKEALRAAAARTWESFVDAVAAALRTITRRDIQHWFEHAGYGSKPARAAL